MCYATCADGGKDIDCAGVCGGDFVENECGIGTLICNKPDSCRSFVRPALDSLNPFHNITEESNQNVPAFVDTDGDEDMDLVMGMKDGTLDYYKNTGSWDAATPPVFTPSYEKKEGACTNQNSGECNPFHSIYVGNNAVPAFVDTDKDGNMDLVVGSYTGDIRFWKNTGNATAPIYERKMDECTNQNSGECNPFYEVPDVGWNSAPAFVDTDGDGDMDLVIGRIAQSGWSKLPGTLKFYYENTGSWDAATPSVFTSSYTRRELALNPFNYVGVMSHQGLETKLAFVDADNDGDMDFLIGNNRAELFYYENTGSASAASYEIKEDALNPFNNVDLYENRLRPIAPAFVDMDGDGDMDLVIGVDGHLKYYWENTGRRAETVAVFRASVTSEALLSALGCAQEPDAYVLPELANRLAAQTCGT